MSGTSIRNKSHYSCGLGVGTANQYLKAAKNKLITHIAITDFCTLGGALDFYNATKDKGIKVAIGVEFAIDYGGDLDTKPISLLCKNQEGYTNLCRLVTIANKNNRVLNVQDIFDNYDGLICITRELRHKQSLSPIFGDNLYFEICPYVEDLDRAQAILSSTPKDKLVLSSDSHMPNIEDKVLQDIMIQNSTFGSKDLTFPVSKYMMGTKELLSTFVSRGFSTYSAHLIEGIKNGQNIIDECSKLELKFTDQIVNYPHILHRLNNDGCDKGTLLRRIITQNNRWDQNDEAYKERLEYEIDSICNNSRVDLIDYFLVLEDLVHYCFINDIPVGPGRGSGPASLVLYGLKVTQLDPIHYGLLFERFISKGRIEAGTLPDVDLDFANQEVVRQYLINLYGEDRVKPIGTYQTLATRGAIKDAFRTLYPESDFSVANKITFLIEDDLKQEGDSEADFFQRQLDENEPFRMAIEPFSRVSEAVSSLVGYNRQPGVHPCGLAITQDPIDEFIPTRITKDKQVLEYQSDHCEQSGVIKYDILGLKTLKFFQTCLILIKEKFRDEDFKYPKTIYDIPLDDKETYAAFEKGDTESVFQFNSDVAKNILTNITIGSLDDLSMVTSVGRPGPMKNGQHFNFMKRKNGEVPPTPPHPALKDLLSDTYGVMIYQESVMKCAQLMGGYSLAETDNIRKAMGKKKLEILLPYKEGFIKYCQENFPDTKNMMPNKGDGDSATSKAEYIWNLMETFSGYGFNKSHSMSYTLIGYYCQYLKTHYPLEWWTACLEHAGDPKNTKKYYAACKDRVLLPSINHSTDKYYILYEKEGIQDENGMDVEGWIVMPFSSVKGVGGVAAEAVQNNAPYASFADFYERAKTAKGRRVNKAVVCNLIFAGAFNCFEPDKEKLLAEYYTLRKDKKIPKEHQNITRDFEQEMKFQVMDFLTLDYIEMFPHLFNHCKYPSQIELVEDGESTCIIGKISKISKRKKKDGDPYLAIEMTNRDETYTCTVWTEEYKFYKEMLVEKEVVRINGKVNHSFRKNQINVSKVHTLKECIKFGGTAI